MEEVRSDNEGYVIKLGHATAAKHNPAAAAADERDSRWSILSLSHALLEVKPEPS